MKRRLYRYNRIGKITLIAVVAASGMLCACDDTTEVAPAVKVEVSNSEKLRLREEGIEYARMGRYDEAIDSFIEAFSKSNGIIKDTDIDIAYYLGMAQYKSGAISDAYDTYCAIVDLRGKDSRAYYLRGKMLLEMGRKDEAVKDFETSIECDDDDYDNYIRICEDLCAAGYESEGNSYIQRAMDNGKRLTDYQKGVLNFYLGQYSEARSFLESARDSATDSTSAVLYLGKTYEHLNDSKYAISLYESELQRNPGAGILYAQLGIAKLNQKDYAGALEAFDAGIAINDESTMQSLLFNRIVANEYLHNFEEAKEQMSDYLSRYPNDEAAKRENEFLSTR